MQTIKTGVVFALLLAVLYGVYTVLNQPALDTNDDFAGFDGDWQAPQVEIPGSNGFAGNSAVEQITGSLGTAAQDLKNQGQQMLESAKLNAGQAVGEFANPAAGQLAAETGLTSTQTMSIPPLTESTPAASPQVPAGVTAAAASTTASADPTAIHRFAQPNGGSAASPTGTAAATPVSTADPTGGSSYVGAGTAASGTPAAVGSTVASGSTVTGSSTASAANSAAAGSLPASLAASSPGAVSPATSSGLPENTYTNPGGTTGSGTDSTAAQSLGTRAFDRDWKKAQTQISKGEYKEALQTLSIYYNSPDLTRQQTQQLLGMLDPLAARVIYSREHMLEPAHKVGQREKLSEIAQKYNVPWQLLRNVNGVADPDVLVPGTELKILRGPFDAEVDLQRSELTLFVNGLYAGRFPISVGSDPTPVAGQFSILGKESNRTYYGSNGATIPAGSSGNPYGRAWLDLGKQMCIHGSPDDPARGHTAGGCISLSPIDAADVYGILSVGSKVVVRR